MVAQPGLRWESALLCAQPIWTIEPQIEAIEKIMRRYLSISDDADEVCVKFFAEGAFNKLYMV